jgi:hypothetical protein
MGENDFAAPPCTRGPDGRGCTLAKGHGPPCVNGLVRWRAPQWKFRDWEIRWNQVDYRRFGEGEWRRTSLFLSTNMDEQLQIFDQLRKGDEVVQHVVGLALLGPKVRNVDGGRVAWLVGWSFKDNYPVLASLPNTLSGGRERRRALEMARHAHRRLLDLEHASRDPDVKGDLRESKAFKHWTAVLEESRGDLARFEVEVDPVDEGGCWPTCGCARKSVSS